MVEQVEDLREEGRQLYQLLSSLDVSDWKRPTPFKGWTVNQVLNHIHGSDAAAMTALKEPEMFRQRQQERRERRTDPTLTGAELLDLWHDHFLEMCHVLDQADPGARVPWVGPDMSVRMMATARQMETWAHGQDVYDMLKLARENTDRIRNIAFIGVKTFRFTFANRNRQPPGAPPFIKLTAPSSDIWEWNDPGSGSSVVGSAVEFCHVVTQGRNIADVQLQVVGDAAIEWMSIAQCFAGPPVDPPAPGERSWP